MVSGKTFRVGLRKPLPCTTGVRQQRIRTVPAFTIQSMQSHTKVEPPKRVDPTKAEKPKPSLFRKHYLRGDFPINLEFDTYGNKVGWRVSQTSKPSKIRF